MALVMRLTVIPQAPFPEPTIELRLIETQGNAATRPGAPLPRQGQRASPSPQPEVNLGIGDDPTNAVAVGAAILPARADRHWHNPEPLYSYAAAARGEHGSVVLVIGVDREGDVRGIDILRSSGFAALDRAALDAVRMWHFVPAIRNGKPIASELPLRVTFKPQ